MKILHIITCLDPGGAEKLLFNTCREQSINGDQVEVIFFKSRGMLKPELERNGIKVTRFEIDGLRIVAAFFRLILFIKKGQFDVVHTHLPHAAFLGRIAALAAGHKNIVNTIHGRNKWYYSNGIIARLIKRMDVFLNNRGPVKVIAISEAEKAYLSGTTGILKGSKIQVLYNAISFEEIEEKMGETPEDINLWTENDFVVTSIGRLSAEKGHIFLVKAVERLANREKINNIKCLLIGIDDNMSEEIKGFVKDNHLEKHVLFLGLKSNPYCYLKRANLHVMPSIHEGFGIAALEAFYCNVPVLSTNADGLVEVVRPNYTGIVIERGSVDQLAKEIRKFYLNQQDTDTLTHNAKEFVKEFNIHSYAAKLRQIYLSGSKEIAG